MEAKHKATKISPMFEGESFVELYRQPVRNKSRDRTAENLTNLILFVGALSTLLFFVAYVR